MRKIRQLFNFSLPQAEPQAGFGETRIAGQQRQGTGAAFLTPQTLATFPGASLALYILWAVVKRLWPDFGAADLVGLAIALIIGVVIYWASVSDPDLRLSRGQRVLGIGVAFFNSVYLFANAVGITAVPKA